MIAILSARLLRNQSRAPIDFSLVIVTEVRMASARDYRLLFDTLLDYCEHLIGVDGRPLNYPDLDDPAGLW